MPLPAALAPIVGGAGKVLGSGAAKNVLLTLLTILGFETLEELWTPKPEKLLQHKEAKAGRSQKRALAMLAEDEGILQDIRRTQESTRFSPEQLEALIALMGTGYSEPTGIGGEEAGPEMSIASILGSEDPEAVLSILSEVPQLGPRTRRGSRLNPVIEASL